MSLSPVFSVSEENTAASINITDVTGVYDAVTNPGGYGTPNIAWASVHDIVFTITDSNGNVLPAVTILQSAFDTNKLINITSLTFGIGAQFDDGIYTLTYDVRDVSLSIVGTITAKFPLFAQTYLCMKNALLKIADGDCGCGCGEQLPYKICEVNTLLLAARYATECGAFDPANKAFKKIKRMCDSICTGC